MVRVRSMKEIPFIVFVQRASRVVLMDARELFSDVFRELLGGLIEGEGTSERGVRGGRC